MVEPKEEVKLHGMCTSPWVRRVTVALKIKGISYEYIEEDLQNKSQKLLEYNPVKKLVPVLVHDGRPILESLIILEYIDETWNNSSPKLFPHDPYQRAMVRFWANFIDLELFVKLSDFVIKARNHHEEEKIVKELQENMSKLEANVKDLYSGTIHTSGETMGILDILMITLLPIINCVEEAIAVKFLRPEDFPLAFAWMKSGDGVPAVRSRDSSRSCKTSRFSSTTYSVLQKHLVVVFMTKNVCYIINRISCSSPLERLIVLLINLGYF